MQDTALGRLTTWFSGGGSYMRLSSCMGDDWTWIAITVALDFAVAAGYVLIARHWGRNERLLADSPAKSALRNMKRIFIFCGVCGYLFIPIKMFWPAWRLYDMFLVGLVYYTWRYALGTHELKVIYEQLDRSAQLTLELNQSRDEARRKSAFLNAISHDIRTPLNAVSLHAELVDMYAASGDFEGLRQSLEEIRACARSAAELLGEFLEIGRLDWAETEPFVEEFLVEDSVNRVLDANRVAAELKGLAISCEVDVGLAISSDRRMLERLLQNLVENGVKYASQGRVFVRAAELKGLVEVEVVDTGIGIAGEHQASIFQEFFQVDNRERHRSKGFGLGLAIVARLAHQIGAELRLESELGRGSRFIVRIPKRYDDRRNSRRPGDDRSAAIGAPAPPALAR